jgi:hypothetical protein
MFLVESTWLALSIWVGEHDMLLGAVALVAVQPAQARARDRLSRGHSSVGSPTTT